METSTAGTWVKVFAILEWIGAAFSVLFAIIMFFGGAAMAGLFAGGSASMAGLFAGLGVFLGVVFLGLAVLCYFVGRGLWKHQNWARILILVFAWIGGVGAVLSILMAAFSGSASTIFQNLVTLIISVFEIWLFQFEPAVKGLFATKA